MRRVTRINRWALKLGTEVLRSGGLSSVQQRLTPNQPYELKIKGNDIVLARCADGHVVQTFKLQTVQIAGGHVLAS